MSKVVIEFDNDDMAHAFVANLLDGGGEETTMVEFNEETDEMEYFIWDHENSKKNGTSFYNYLRYTKGNDE